MSDIDTTEPEVTHLSGHSFRLALMIALAPIVQPRPITVDSLIVALRSIVLRSATVQSRIAASSPT